MMPFGSRKDRHAVIGGGEIGIEALLNVMRHPKLKDLPFYLETPLMMRGIKKKLQGFGILPRWSDRWKRVVKAVSAGYRLYRR